MALARFAEYSGVGSAVARGCGAVKVEVGEGVAMVADAYQDFIRDDDRCDYRIC